MKNKTIKNIANFHPKGILGGLFIQAKNHNQLNSQLKKLLKKDFNGISLCLVEGETIYFIAKTPNIAYLANKEKIKLLNIIKKIKDLEQTKNIFISVNNKKY